MTNFGQGKPPEEHLYGGEMALIPASVPGRIRSVINQVRGVEASSAESDFVKSERRTQMGDIAAYMLIDGLLPRDIKPGEKLRPRRRDPIGDRFFPETSLFDVVEGSAGINFAQKLTQAESSNQVDG